VKQNELDGDSKSTVTIGFGGKLSSSRRQIIDNLENGKKYVGFTKTSYLNMMLGKQVLRIEERPARYMSFLPQEVVRHEVWTRGL